MFRSFVCENQMWSHKKSYNFNDRNRSGCLEKSRPNQSACLYYLFENSVVEKIQTRSIARNLSTAKRAIHQPDKKNRKAIYIKMAAEKSTVGQILYYLISRPGSVWFTSGQNVITTTCSFVCRSFSIAYFR